MSFRSSFALLKVPHFATATLAVLLTLLAEAIAGSYTALLAVQKIGMSPLELSAFLTVAAISGIGVTTLFGHLHDRRPVLWPLLLSLVAKIVGFALCAVVTDSWTLIAIAFVLFGLASASFPLLFSIAKGYLDKVGGETVSRGMASLRMTSSLGWAIGPALGAVLVAFWRFEGVFFGAAALGLVALVTVLASGIKIVPAAVEVQPRITLAVVRATAPVVLALTFFNTVMFMGSNAMSIVVVRQLGGETDVGLLYSLCAALEVLVMGIFVVRPMAAASRGLLLFGFALFIAYFVLLMLVPTLPAFYFGQVLRAAAIGIISIVGMAYIQELLPSRTGVASALFGNTMTAGALLSGLGTGLWAEAFGYWSIFGLSALLCGIGGLTLAIFRPRARP